MDPSQETLDRLPIGIPAAQMGWAIRLTVGGLVLIAVAVVLLGLSWTFEAPSWFGFGGQLLLYVGIALLLLPIAWAWIVRPVAHGLGWTIALFRR